MKFKTISAWLSWIKSNSVKDIDLSLERVMVVSERLLIKPKSPIITVAGTNGKGSTVAGLEMIYRMTNFKVGAFTSPFIFNFNEQVRVNGVPVSEEILCDAFNRVQEAAIDMVLTQFEMTTLAAFIIFMQNNLDVWILEVGLGGRFDAVNVMSADLSIITTIALDHTEWLGNTRDQIAYEKCGIFRRKQLAVSGDYDPPKKLIECAKDLEVSLFCQNQEFGFEEQIHSWNWHSKTTHFENLPRPQLALQNMSTVLMAIELLQNKLPVKRSNIDDALKKVHLQGRIQVIEGDVTHILDVSHNPASVAHLAKFLEKHPAKGKTYAVFSMLADKDIQTTISEIKEWIHHWFIGPIQHERGVQLDVLKSYFNKLKIRNLTENHTLQRAYEYARESAELGDRIIIFGSFHTISSINLL